ncbi:MAG: hypothetical protein K8J09_19585 [Planctomycetes bacterium]|nr:hypothetical protein [Planctomycetota bacterium]
MASFLCLMTDEGANEQLVPDHDVPSRLAAGWTLISYGVVVVGQSPYDV